jgi:hypothetical protein
MKNILMTIENMRDAVTQYGKNELFTYNTIQHVRNDTDIIVNLIDMLYNDEFERYTKYQTDDLTKQTELMLKFLYVMNDNEWNGFVENFHVIDEMIENGELK